MQMGLGGVDLEIQDTFVNPALQHDSPQKAFWAEVRRNPHFRDGVADETEFAIPLKMRVGDSLGRVRRRSELLS